MTSQYVLIGIVVGVFLAGLSVGYAIFINTYNPSYAMMQNPQQFNQMMSNNPQFMNAWVNNMMSNPQAMNTWMNTMLQNPQFMNQWMVTMMQNSQFQQQYMGPWMMVQDPRFMQGMMNQWPIQLPKGEYAHLIVKTDQVSIVDGAWKYNTTESYSPTIIQIVTGTTVT